MTAADRHQQFHTAESGGEPDGVSPKLRLNQLNHLLPPNIYNNNNNNI